mmetsp:Transcript_71053/g.148155  ORF Transcript_71053/g.148155 Transcript_71053/m.148155 type:complete len:410 (-) Transcript_71053:351-1580(-)
MFTLAGNLYKYLKKRKEKNMTIIILGLDNAGKTTLLYSLKNEVPGIDATPTVGFRQDKIVSGKYTIQWFDVGGAKNFRRTWTNYYSEVHGIIYVVDAAAEDRLEESKEVLTQTLKADGIPGKPVLVFANKQDLPGCMSDAELSKRLGMLDWKDCSYSVHACQAKPNGDQIDPRIGKGLKWLLDSIDSKYKTLQTRVERDMQDYKEKEKKRKEDQKKRAEASKAARLKEMEEKEAAAAAAAAAGGGAGEGDAAAAHTANEAATTEAANSNSNKVMPIPAETPGKPEQEGEAAGTREEERAAVRQGASLDEGIAEEGSSSKEAHPDVLSPPRKLAALETESSVTPGPPPMTPQREGEKEKGDNNHHKGEKLTPGPKLGALKPMPPIQTSPECTLPNAIPSPQLTKTSAPPP